MASSKVNGPDMIDCEALMRAISSLHGGTVVLTIFPEGIGGGTGLKVNLTRVEDNFAEGQSTEVIGVSSVWPCALHRDFWACVFEGLYKLDFAIGQSYRQEPLKEA